MLSKTICQILQTNVDIILNNLLDCIQSERFFIYYNNINFYKKVYNHQFHNYV